MQPLGTEIQREHTLNARTCTPAAAHRLVLHAQRRAVLVQRHAAQECAGEVGGTGAGEGLVRCRHGAGRHCLGAVWGREGAEEEE